MRVRAFRQKFHDGSHVQEVLQIGRKCIVALVDHAPGTSMESGVLINLYSSSGTAECRGGAR